MRSSAREIRRGDHTPRRTPPSLQTLLLGRLLGSVGVYGGASTHTRTRRSRLHMLDGEHAAAAASEPRVPTLRKRLPHNAYPRRAVGRPRSGRFRAACPRPGRRPTRASSSFSSSSSRSRPRTWRAYRRSPRLSGPGCVSPRPVFLAAGTALESSPASRRRRYRKSHVVRKCTQNYELARLQREEEGDARR